MNKNMRAGFQGKHDSMRALADKLMNHPGSAKDVYSSASAPDKEKMRLYKKGGPVKKSCNKFAAGGVAKIRHKEATNSGAPIPPAKQRKRCRSK